MPSAGQDLVRNLFEYVTAYHQLKTPCVRDLNDQPWSLYLTRLPMHGTVQYTPPACSELSASCALLRVGRAELQNPPTPPELLEGWLDGDWRRQSELSHLDCIETVIQGTPEIEYFSEKQERLEAFTSWKMTFDEWFLNDQSARMALTLFEKLYELHGRLARENESWEIVVGDGNLMFGGERLRTEHPVLTQALQLEFDPKKPEFLLSTTAKAPELYVALLTALGLDGRLLNGLQEEIEGGHYSPLGADETTAFLKGLVQRFQNGLYVEERLATTPDRYVLYRKPVIFLRRRDLGFARALGSIQRAIEAGAKPTEALLKVVGLFSDDQDGSKGLFQDQGTGEASSSEREGTSSKWDDRDVLFSKESNAEQFEIAHRLKTQRTVLVQGPPGTGKTHTIANLIGSLLAEGKSVLVTSQASKPLRILREKIVPELRPLCVSVVEGDEAGRRQLESSVNGITARLASDSESQLELQATQLTRERNSLMDRIQFLRESIVAAANGEYRAILVGDEETAPSDAARYVRDEMGRSDWIPGPVQVLVGLPISIAEVAFLYASNAKLTKEDVRELRCQLPANGDLQTPEEFLALARESEQLATVDNDSLLRQWDTQMVDPPKEALRDVSKRAEAALAFLMGEAPAWADSCLLAGVRGEASQRVWRMLIAFSLEVRAVGVELESEIVLKRPKLAEEPFQDQSAILSEIVTFLSSGSSLNRFTLLLKGEWRRMIGLWRVRGVAPHNLEDFQSLTAFCNLQQQRNDLCERWKAVSVSTHSLDLGVSEPESLACQAIPGIKRALDWFSKEWEPIVQAVESLGLRWSEFERSRPAKMVAAGELLQLRETAGAMPNFIQVRLLQLRKRELETSKEKLHQLALVSGAFVLTDLRKAVGDLDVKLYEGAYTRLAALSTLREDHERREQLLKTLHMVAPLWAAALEQRTATHGASVPSGDAIAAWRWTQFSQELNKRSSVSLHTLQAELDLCQGNLFTVTAQLIDRLAWRKQAGRITHDQRAALQGWVDTMRRVGAGTGIQATRLLAHARELMNRCKAAVPVWIMPLSRVVDSFDPVRTSFDVVIVDEASQCDLSGLIALWMAKEVVIVGDHQQVSPDAIGQNITQIAALQATFLNGIPNAHLYDGQLSLYDLARQSFAGRVCLREHFRCAPEIIQFSNVLSYDGEIKPLRDTSGVPMKPSIVSYCVPTGIRRGDHNDEEALTIASLIAAAVRFPEYDKATFGTISLHGTTQAPLIDKLLRHKLPASVYEERQIMCGTPSHFQGDERNVIFLSMVDSPPANGLLTTRGAGPREMYKKRYNVAASRAQDQMWVVHSMDRLAHLSPLDLRRRLLDHACDPSALMAPLDQSRNEVDSEFERLVLRDLQSRRFRVTPQWKVGSYRIDLVVEGSRERLAIECDGDRYHTMENLQADMARQSVLERLGWRFFRIRGSEFFRDPAKALEPLYARLERMGIEPSTSIIDSTPVNFLSRKVIEEAKGVREEWETDLERLDEILSRNRFAKGNRIREPIIEIDQEVHLLTAS